MACVGMIFDDEGSFALLQAKDPLFIFDRNRWTVTPIWGLPVCLFFLFDAAACFKVGEHQGIHLAVIFNFAIWWPAKMQNILHRDVQNFK